MREAEGILVLCRTLPPDAGNDSYRAATVDRHPTLDSIALSIRPEIDGALVFIYTDARNDPTDIGALYADNQIIVVAEDTDDAAINFFDSFPPGQKAKLEAYAADLGIAPVVGETVEDWLIKVPNAIEPRSFKGMGRIKRDNIPQVIDCEFVIPTSNVFNPSASIV